MASRDIFEEITPLDDIDVIDLTAAEPIPRLRSHMDVPFVDLGAEHRLYRLELDQAIASVVDTSSFVLGDEVEAFERAFASYCGTAHAVGVDSGFSALELILRAYGIGPGDEVITTANTFVATVAAIDCVGARPVLVDVDPETRCIDVDAVAAAITSRTRAVLPVHLFGRIADMVRISELAERHDLVVVEDACQAHGALDDGRRAGSLGHAAAFSFYPSKNLGAFGDGGMVVTDDHEVAATVRMLRNVGSVEKYVHEIRGYNRRLDTIHAAVLGVKLGHLDTANDARRRAAARYSSLLDELPVSVPAVSERPEHVFHLYVIETDRRDELADHLRARGVATGIHYPIPVHLQPAYGWLGYERGAFPVSEQLAGRILSLPMFPTITVTELAYVVRATRAFFEGSFEWT